MNGVHGMLLFVGAPASGIAKLQLQRARALLDIGRPQAALLESEKALSSEPENAEALQIHGLCLLHLERYDDARRSIGSAIQHRPDEAHNHYLLGYAHAEQQHRDLAEACYRESLRLSPEEPVYLRALAELLVEQKRGQGALAEAMELAKKAVQLGPERASNHITLGYVSSAMDDRVAARACYQKALSIDPNNALAWNNLGCVDLAQGRPVSARARFRESLRLDPEGKVARENLKLVQPNQRPPTIYKEYAAFERQLITEVWDTVLFNRTHASRSRAHAARTKPVGPPLTPGQFFRNYFLPRKVEDDPRLHAAALLWATDFRPLPGLLWRMPQILLWLGASLSLLRLGPAGIVVSLTSNAATYLFSRKPLRRRYEAYKEELLRLHARWQGLQDAWINGDVERPQRDASIDGLIDEFARFSESLRERLHNEEQPE